MTTYDMNTLQPFTPTVRSLPYPDEVDDPNMPVVTVRARFDWKFWAGIAAGVVALYILSHSMKRAARHG